MVLFPVAAGLYNMLIAKPGFECVHAGVRVLKFSFCSDVQYYQKVCFKAIIYSFFPCVYDASFTCVNLPFSA